MQLLEHVHVNVDSIAATRDFLEVAVPEIVRRGGGDDPNYGSWFHIGTESNYIALTEKPGSKRAPTLRHIGIVVNDIEKLISRLAAAGHEPADASELNGHPFRRRIYYNDGNGLDWEFVEYLSDNINERNDYSL